MGSPSAGIDPQTGQEIYIKKDGTYTYTYSANDMVAAGNSDPKYRGTGGFTAEYKGIGLSATISYLAGQSGGKCKYCLQCGSPIANWSLDYSRTSNTIQEI